MSKLTKKQQRMLDFLNLHYTNLTRALNMKKADVRILFCDLPALKHAESELYRTGIKIKISHDYLRKWNEKEMSEIACHEICHCICFIQDLHEIVELSKKNTRNEMEIYFHGEKWQEFMKICGFDPMEYIKRLKVFVGVYV